MNSENVKETIKSTKQLNTTYLGYRTSSLGVEENIELEDHKRSLNVLNVGPIGYGKTQLMAHVVLQDIQKGYGAAVINPKGGLIDELIGKIPDECYDDIIYINPARDNVTPINVLDVPVTDAMSVPQMENQKEIVVSDLIAIFKRYSMNWGDRFGRVLETLLRAHLDLNIYHDEQNTLLDVFEAASDKQTLGELADRTRDNILHQELIAIKKGLTEREMEPVIRRLKDFVENKTVKRVIDSPESGVDFKEAINEGKIILVDIQKGEIGTAPAQLIGTLVITSIWAAVQNRITIPANQRTPFLLFIDELQNFAQEGSNLRHILAECREYGMGLWLASQYLNQLSSETRRAVTNNCRTKIFFNPSGSEDVGTISGMLRGVSKHELTGLGKYRAVIQTPGTGLYSDAVIFDTYPPFPTEASREEVEEVKQQATVAGKSWGREIERDSGDSGAAGSAFHDELLREAKQYLEFTEEVQVNILHQDGSSKPDAHIIGEDDVAHLEAEHSTLTKPERVLTNLERAVDLNRDCVFVVKETEVDRLQGILKEADTDQYRILIATDLGVIDL